MSPSRNIYVSSVANPRASKRDAVPSKHAIVVCTKDRPKRVEEFLKHLASLELSPQLFVLVDSTASEQDFSRNSSALRHIEKMGWQTVHIKDTPGLPHQRNSALNYLNAEQPNCEIVSFLDDDILVDANYFQVSLDIFRKYSSLIVLGGFDRKIVEMKHRTLFSRLAPSIFPTRPGIIAKSGLAMVPIPKTELDIAEFVPGGMQSIRLSMLGAERFNESSRFFGEDLEMHFRLARTGTIASSNLLPVTHLGATESKSANGSQELNEHLVRMRLHLTDPNRVKFLPLLLAGLLLASFDTFRALASGKWKTLPQVIYNHSLGIVIVIAKKMGFSPKSLE